MVSFFLFKKTFSILFVVVVVSCLRKVNKVSTEGEHFSTWLTSCPIFLCFLRQLLDQRGKSWSYFCRPFVIFPNDISNKKSSYSEAKEKKSFHIYFNGFNKMYTCKALTRSIRKAIPLIHFQSTLLYSIQFNSILFLASAQKRTRKNDHFSKTKIKIKNLFPLDRFLQYKRFFFSFRLKVDKESSETIPKFSRLDVETSIQNCLFKLNSLLWNKSILILSWFTFMCSCLERWWPVDLKQIYLL